MGRRRVCAPVRDAALVLSNVDIATQPSWRFEATTSSRPIVVAELKLDGCRLHTLGVIFHDAQPWIAMEVKVRARPTSTSPSPRGGNFLTDPASTGLIAAVSAGLREWRVQWAQLNRNRAGPI